VTRLFLRITLSLQLLLLAAVFLLEWASHKYMTMMRIVLYQNRRLESMLPLDLITAATKTTLLILGAFAAYALVRRLLRGMPFRSAQTFQLALLALMAGGSALHMSLNSVVTFRTYYFSAALLTILCLLQLPAALIRGEKLVARNMRWLILTGSCSQK